MSDTANKKPRLRKSLVQAKISAAQAAMQIDAQFSDLNRKERMLVIKAFQAQLIPPGRRGRKRSQGITAAHADWKKGSRGDSLYRNHSPHFDQMSLWRRKYEIRRLLDAIRNRERRVGDGDGPQSKGNHDWKMSVGRFLQIVFISYEGQGGCAREGQFGESRSTEK
jgi:hypothetical protein